MRVCLDTKLTSSHDYLLAVVNVCRTMITYIPGPCIVVKICVMEFFWRKAPSFQVVQEVILGEIIIFIYIADEFICLLSCKTGKLRYHFRHQMITSQLIYWESFEPKQ